MGEKRNHGGPSCHVSASPTPTPTPTTPAAAARSFLILPDLVPTANAAAISKAEPQDPNRPLPSGTPRPTPPFSSNPNVVPPSAGAAPTPTQAEVQRRQFHKACHVQRRHHAEVQQRQIHRVWQVQRRALHRKLIQLPMLKTLRSSRFTLKTQTTAWQLAIPVQPSKRGVVEKVGLGTSMGLYPFALRIRTTRKSGSRFK